MIHSDDLPLRAEKALIEAMRGHLIKSVESFVFFVSDRSLHSFFSEQRRHSKSTSRNP